MEKKKRFTTIFTLIIMILILGVGGYEVYKANQDTPDVGNVGSDANGNYYALRANASEYQKELYDELILAIDTNDENATVGLIAQNFIADFFTWTNKVRLNDVGGLQFVDPLIINDVSFAAQDGIYNDMYTYLKEGKIEGSLQVKSSNVLVSQGEFLLENQEQPTEEIDVDPISVPAYFANVTWEYEDSTVLNTTVYQNRATLTLTKDEDGLFSIVEVKEYAQ